MSASRGSVTERDTNVNVPVFELVSRFLVDGLPAHVLGDARTKIHDMTDDIRRVAPGVIYMPRPTKGVNADLLGQAIIQGAAALLVEAPVDGLAASCPQIVVSDASLALKLWKRFSFR